MTDLEQIADEIWRVVEWEESRMGAVSVGLLNQCIQKLRTLTQQPRECPDAQPTPKMKAEGRTVVIRKLTEAQACDMAEGHFTFMMPNEKRVYVNGWLACARAWGAIAEDEHRIGDKP